MNTIDMRFDPSLFQAMIGQEFKKYKADPFVYTNSVTQIVGLFIGDAVYKLTNIQETVDYFGYEDDASIFKITACQEDEIQSAFKDIQQIETPVNETIKEIVLVNENQRLFQNGIQTYDVWLTRGIIFRLPEREISFEKQIVSFSEEIEIQRGYNVIDSFGSTDHFLDGWDEGIMPECSRDIITIK